MNHRATTQQRQLQDKIAAQTAAFLKAGGIIQAVEVIEGRNCSPKNSDFSINGKSGDRVKRKPVKV